MHEDIRQIIEEQYRVYVLEPFYRANPGKREEVRKLLLQEVENRAESGVIDRIFASDVKKYLGYE